MFHKIRIACRDQWQLHGPRVGHVAGGVQPVFEEEEHAEGKRSRLSLRKEVTCKRERNHPLQDGSAPQPEDRTKPSEQQVPAFVYDQVGAIDKEKSAALAPR